MINVHIHNKLEEKCMFKWLSKKFKKINKKIPKNINKKKLAQCIQKMDKSVNAIKVDINFTYFNMKTLICHFFKYKFLNF